MKVNQLSGKAAENKPWLNYLTAVPKVVCKTRGANREDRREKDRDVRLELKHLPDAMKMLKPASDEYKILELRQSELEFYEASPHKAVNEPYIKDVD